MENFSGEGDLILLTLTNDHVTIHCSNQLIKRADYFSVYCSVQSAQSAHLRLRHGLKTVPLGIGLSRVDAI